MINNYQFAFDHERLDVVDRMDVVHGVNHDFANLEYFNRLFTNSVKMSLNIVECTIV
jgi:hypothetical protein